MSLGKVTGKMLERQAQEPSVWGNNDNPVSGNHQALSQWKNSGTMILTSCLPQRGREGREWSRWAHNETGKEHELISTAKL